MTDLPTPSAVDRAWLLRTPADQIIRYGPETVIEWLIACNEQHRARLRFACQQLRGALADQAIAADAYRLAAARTINREVSR